MQPAERIIVALDRSDATSALRIADRLEDQISFYKIGLELFTAEGAAVVHALKRRNKRVFLDLKFHDIPNTVAGAVRSVAKLGVDMITVHASGGPAMMQAAADAARASEHPPIVLAVTVLTSIDVTTLRSINVQATPQQQVDLLAWLAVQSGCGGVVCSSQEVAEVRTLVGRDVKLVVPGIRPAGSLTDDQKRVATPSQALRSGADYLVIGRPITGADDPLSAARAIVREIGEIS